LPFVAIAKKGWFELRHQYAIASTGNWCGNRSANLPVLLNIPHKIPMLVKPKENNNNLGGYSLNYV